MEDHELMRRVANGDLDAFSDIVSRYQQTAIEIAVRFTADPVEAQDIAQDTFLKILTAAPRYKPSGSFRSYLITVLSRLCLDRHRRKSPVYTENIPDISDPALDPRSLRERSVRNQRIAAALARLPENQRLVVILRYYESMGYAGIAQSLGTTEKSVEHLLARGRRRLAQLLGDL